MVNTCPVVQLRGGAACPPLDSARLLLIRLNTSQSPEFVCEKGLIVRHQHETEFDPSGDQRGDTRPFISQCIQWMH